MKKIIIAIIVYGIGGIGLLLTKVVEVVAVLFLTIVGLFFVITRMLYYPFEIYNSYKRVKEFPNFLYPH